MLKPIRSGRPVQVYKHRIALARQDVDELGDLLRFLVSRRSPLQPLPVSFARDPELRDRTSNEVVRHLSPGHP
jgi:hypothetical protein